MGIISEYGWTAKNILGDTIPHGKLSILGANSQVNNQKPPIEMKNTEDQKTEEQRLVRLWNFLWPWSKPHLLKRQALRCEKGQHDTIVKHFPTGCWAAEDRELHCRHCGFLKHLPPKINYD